MGFSSVMQTCVLSSDRGCQTAVNDADRAGQASFRASWHHLPAIRSAAPNARVVVLDYPSSTTGRLLDLPGPVRHGPEPLNNAADTLDGVIQPRRRSAGFSFADVGPGSPGTSCAITDEWLHR